MAGVLDGITISKNSIDVQNLCKRCREHEVEVWLPDGSGHGTAAGCFSSPYIHNLGSYQPSSSWSKPFTSLASTRADPQPSQKGAIDSSWSSRNIAKVTICGNHSPDSFVSGLSVLGPIMSVPSNAACRISLHHLPYHPCASCACGSLSQLPMTIQSCLL